ncbi:MAG TPA: prolyl oligopeptidase family serine peptidase [Candidatus Sulfopaludibacter sp.]|nr:prolyl oligopeptidase family serine peptidase [Candidatus Sulfopaludibacter sp.]
MKTSPYGTWKSPITADLIVAQSIGLSEIRLDGDDVYWLESRPQEAGRSVVVRRAPGNPAAQDINPAPFNVRSRVHEYGGGAWTVSNGVLYFSHFADNRLYRMSADAASPTPLSPEGPWRYADGIIDRPRRRWIGVQEDHTAAEAVNRIVAIDTEPGSGAIAILASGHDFYSSPQLSPDGRRLAYLAWDHPNMPWTGTSLYVVELNANGHPAGDPQLQAGGPRESIFQPTWSPDGAELFYVSDRTGWWNLYRQAWGAAPSAVAPMDAEFGQPQWVFGMSTYAFAGTDRLVCSYASKGLGRLATIDLESGVLTPLDVPWTDFSSVRASANRVVFRGGSPTMPGSMLALDLDSGTSEILRQSTTVSGSFSPAEPIEFPTSGGKTAFGLYYPAANPEYRAPEGDLPPLVVKCHGGPTAAASSTLDLRIQFWTSRGIAVLDVNYGGSTGFGREYRERLDGNWGVVDVDDCVNGARFLAERGLVDGKRCVITGGSAGGYTTLAALTFRDTFQGGASHYGVSDPVALTRDTHKFESRYLDSLIGPYPEKEALYRERSPIAHADRLRVPVIFFQGDQDMVVPPNQTELMVDALRKNGTPVGYLLFSGEQHGFRKSESIKRSLDAELYFYAINVFGISLTW